MPTLIPPSLPSVDDLLDQIPFSDATIAKFLGVSRQAVCNWKSGGSLTFENYQKLHTLVRWRMAMDNAFTEQKPNYEWLIRTTSDATHMPLYWRSEMEMQDGRDPHKILWADLEAVISDPTPLINKNN